MYSQNNEEEIIVNYFAGKQGRFMDIGAYNPFKFSNTRRLYELGWKGVYVEPSPICFKSFMDEYKTDMEITLINKAVVTNDVKEIEFFEANGDAVSTSNHSHRDKWSNAGAIFKPIQVEAIHIINLLENFGKGIDFLNIDVESMNYDLFSNIDEQYLSNLSMICIEHDNYWREISSKMSRFGFKEILLNGENIILVK